MTLSSHGALFNLCLFVPAYLHCKGKPSQLEEPESLCFVVTHSLPSWYSGSTDLTAFICPNTASP